MFKSFSHPMFWVQDVDAAVEWYSRVLGFTPVYHAPGKYATLGHESMACRLDLHGADREVARGDGPVPYFAALDIDAAVAALREKGVRVDDVQQQGDSPRFTSFYDAEGNELGIEETRR
jgi:catechol 2,3-dioxygenase-like lactoylglutathione lyase family enzyme